MATTAMDDVRRLRGQSSPGISPRHVDKGFVDRPLLDELLSRWQLCYRAEAPAHDDVALFRSLNTANFAALMPAGVEVTMYDIGRQVSLWVSAFEILFPTKSSAFYKVYDNLKAIEYGPSAINTPIMRCTASRRPRQKTFCPAGFTVNSTKPEMTSCTATGNKGALDRPTAPAVAAHLCCPALPAGTDWLFGLAV
jgi:hypothetical protein